MNTKIKTELIRNAAGKVVGTRTTSAEYRKAMGKVMGGALTRKFDLMWSVINGPPLEAEHKFKDDRKFRFDRAHVESKVAIELDGGHYSGGRHTRPIGFANDCEKMNIATLAGWRVFRLTSNMIHLPLLHEIADFIRMEMKPPEEP